MQKTDERLSLTMRTIHDHCARTAHRYGADGDLLTGADIAGFERVAIAMAAQGLI
ncbi:MAG: hypothetical protein R2698_13480 [Microthrixaceae bacterium]